MKSTRTRFTIDLEPSFQRRLKALAALKGMTMRQYCIAAIGKEMRVDQTEGRVSMTFDDEAIVRMAALQKEVFQNQQVAGDSADLIREARNKRTETL